jgi:hypothetical protein
MPMREFTLGVLGGCLSHQIGVPPSQLYHRRLARQLRERGAGRLRVRIARDFDNHHVARLEQLRQSARLDAVLVHVRSEFTRKASLITIHVRPDGIHYYLHPFLLRQRQYGWADVERHQFSNCLEILRRQRRAGSPQSPVETSELPTDALDTPPGATRVAGISIRDGFYAAGAVVGLHRWAMGDELRMLRDLSSRCQQLHLPLLVLGPSRRPDNGWLDHLCINFDRKLEAVLGQWCLPYCSLPDTEDQAGEALYGADGFHFTPAGHGYVADRLLAGVQGLIG